MGVAEHYTNGAVEWSPDAAPIGDSPLQIRMNPFLACTSGLALTDPRAYLQQQAGSIGRRNLFTPEALDIIVDGSRDAPTQLRSIAQLAFFAAAAERGCQIQSRHATNALASLIPCRDDIKCIAATYGHAGLIDAKREAVSEYPSAFESTGSAVAAQPSARQEIIPVQPAVFEDDLEWDVTPPLEGARNAVAVYRSAFLVAPHTPPASSAMVVAATPAAKVRQRRWVSRSVAISTALVVLFFAAGAISSNVMSDVPKGASRTVAVAAAPRPVEVTKAVVQEPAATEGTFNISVPDQSAPQESKPIQQAGLQPSAPKEISTSVPKPLGTANRTIRKKRVAAQPAARSQAEDEVQEATAAPDRLKADNAVTGTPRQISRSDEAVLQAAALKNAEEKALSESAAQRVANEKAVAKMAVAEMLHADQARALEDAAREARLAADTAQAEKEAADRATAEVEKNKGGLRFGTKGIRIF